MFCSIIAQCTAETAPLNGVRTPDVADIAVDATLTLSCDTGYALVGDAIGTCTDAGDGTSPTFNPVLSATTCGKCYAPLTTICPYKTSCDSFAHTILKPASHFNIHLNN